MKKLVIMPGGFHPFHAGHMALYNAAREAFPSAEVFVAATDDTSGRPFPFRIKKFLAQQAGVPGNRFIRVKSPFRAEEITQMYDPDETVLIFVRSEKDAQKQPQAGGVKKDGSAAYLQPYKRNGLEPFSRRGYMAYLPTVQFGPGMTSATEIRAKWPEMSPEEKISLVKVLYPGTVKNEAAAGKIVTMFDEIMGAIQENRTAAQASLLGAPFGVGAGGLDPTNLRMPNGPDREPKGVRMGVEFDESVLDEGVREKLIAAGMAGIMALGALAPQAAKAEVQKEPAKAAQAVKQSDLGKGVKRTDFKDGTHSIQDASGITVYDATGKVVQKVSPRIAGYQQSQQADGSITQNLDQTDQDGLGMKLSRSNGQTSASMNIAGQQLSNEATLINDPDAGMQIRPAGGMGTWDEASLVSNLARKFASMVDMVKNRNYKGLHYALYQAGAVENMVRALAELEAFQQRQGRRPVARGREIDITDYLEEK